MTIHILVAGDRPLVADLAREAFDDLDCQIIPATSLTLAVFLAQKNLPDLILSDFTMHDGDGISYIHEIKADTELSGIPFLFISDKRDPELDALATKAGADGILSFPLEPSQLKREVLPFINIRLAEKGQRLEQTPE